jgi:hypothetical protein
VKSIRPHIPGSLFTHLSKIVKPRRKPVVSDEFERKDALKVIGEHYPWLILTGLLALTALAVFVLVHSQTRSNPSLLEENWPQISERNLPSEKIPTNQLAVIADLKSANGGLRTQLGTLEEKIKDGFNTAEDDIELRGIIDRAAELSRRIESISPDQRQ